MDFNEVMDRVSLVIEKELKMKPKDIGYLYIKVPKATSDLKV